MPLTVTLELSDDELDYFRSLTRSARSRRPERSAADTAAAAAREIGLLRSTARSPFILRRVDRVDRLIAMLDDPQWQLPEPDRARVLEALAYVADAQDLVPDGVPVLGLLDDAIVLELVLRDLKHEIEAYDEFSDYRRQQAGRVASTHDVSRQDWLDSRREALHSRMRERRRRDLAGHGFDLITRF